MPIEVGHIIQTIIPESRKHIVSPVKGVVYKKTYNDSLKCYSLFIKPIDKMGLTVIMTAKPVYGDHFVLVDMMKPTQLAVIQEQMKPFEGPPKSTKTPVKRGSMKIREDAVLTPNTNYENKGIEGYITTQKTWGRIQKTTAKMVMYHNGSEFKRCSINNVSEVRPA